MSDTDECTGYPVGNFGVAGEITPAGSIFSRVLYNPPVLGEWLQELGRGRFSFDCGGVEIADSDFADARVQRLFPQASAVYADPRLPGLTIRARFFAPLKAGDAFISSIPALCAEFELTNEAREAVDVSCAFGFERDIDEHSVTLTNSGSFWMVGDEAIRFGFASPIAWKGIPGGIQVSATAQVPSRGASTIRFLLLCWHRDGCYSLTCPDAASLAAYVGADWEAIRRDVDEFIRLLPRTHDEQIDRYLRWYLSAGVLLTRITREHVLTMGYCELNQRDSYWTSWPHLVLWPELERRMIEESARFQRPSGKIPTTVLPVIEREDDIDINEYFCLRIARYYEWTRDIEFLRRIWPSFGRSVDYLVSMDKDDDGLLDQGSFWADWKDVSGVEGRKAAPHFELLWLAVLKSAAELALQLNDARAADRYRRLYERSSAVVHAPVRQGGLWNGRFYTTLWHDGRADNHVHEDQFVGPLFGVVPEERISSVYASMEPGMAPWGMRDTWPYRDHFSHAGGDYHNGGVWVFLNFADALSRFVAGYPDGGFELLKRVGEWDLEKWGDYQPAEFLDGNSGKNAGRPIQGWDADFYGAVLFGILGVRVIDRQSVEIMPRIPDTATFESPITLPQGVLFLSQTASPNSLTIDIESRLTRPIRLRYGAMTERSASNAATQQVGQCRFQVLELRLAPGDQTRVSFA